MKDRKLLHPSIIKGRPIFKRHLYISSALFAAIILITTFTLFRLATDSLRDQVSAELVETSEGLAQIIREQIQNTNARLGASNPETELQRHAEIQSFIEGLVTQQDEMLYILIQELKGEILWKAIRRGMELEQNQFSKILISPRSSRAPRMEVTSLGNPNMVYIDLIEPIFLFEQPELIVHFGIDKNAIENRFSGLRAGIVRRILLGSSVVVGILSLAFAYVFWLLKRAQVVEAEAHVADRLAYLGTLAGGLAHEIRNPLNAINLNLQMIEEDVTGGTADISELSALLKGTKQEISRLDRLATNFLVYAKPLELEKQQFVARELLDEVLRLVSRECATSGITLVKDDCAHPVKLRADRDLLKQAILNLIVNAQEAVLLKEPGQREIRLSVTAEEGQVGIRVRDSGPGLGAEEARNLFKLFYSSKRGGTGLGLPIAQRIVESHGGRIEWRNVPQGGAEFTVWLSS
jgi:signal transduction histidine kinase